MTVHVFDVLVITIVILIMGMCSKNGLCFKSDGKETCFEITKGKSQDEK